MNKSVSKVILGLAVLFSASACSSRGTNSKTKLFSKNVVYHAYKNVGGNYSTPSYSDDFGYLLDDNNILEWSKDDEGEETAIFGEYKVSNDGHIWAKFNNSYSSNFIMWGEITVGVLEVYEAAADGRSVWYITEDYYHNCVL